jgi:restriction system protein
VAKEKEEEGAKFVRYFGPLLDALRALGGSAKADEAVDRVAEDLELPDNVLNEVELPRFSGRFSAWVTSGYPQAARGALLSQPSAQACG